MNKIKKYFSLLLLLFLNSSAFTQKTMLDLTQSEQQKDFLKYLKTTISLLEDKNMKDKMKGYQLKSLTDSNKLEIAEKIIKDTAYFKKLNDYFSFMRILENKYHISQFSGKEWDEVSQFGASHGIYFISAMKKFKEQKDSPQQIPKYFPVMPLNKTKDTIPSHNFLQ